MKAGGPNYVAQLMAFADRARPVAQEPIADPCLRDLHERLIAVEIDAAPEEVARILAALASYNRAAREEFGREHDHFRLLGQDNIRRYLPLREIRVRVHPADSVFEIFARVCAAQAAGCRVLLSAPPDSNRPAVQMLDDLTDSWAGSIEFLEENDAQLEAALRAGAVERIRLAAPERISPALRAASAEMGVHLADTPVLGEGRIELLWYLREQSVSFDYHRYGNLGARSGERRAEPG
jgi:RHH-type proline utilization regulon transcriptional repressor/proline dehydrogenase/delta 1-pyrroline-5-carboxylate dehydrogenase